MGIGPEFFNTVKITVLAGRVLSGEDFQLAAANDAVETAIREAKPGAKVPPAPTAPVPVVRRSRRRSLLASIVHERSGERVGDKLEVAQTPTGELVAVDR